MLSDQRLGSIREPVYACLDVLFARRCQLLLCRSTKSKDHVIRYRLLHSKHYYQADTAM